MTGICLGGVLGCLSDSEHCLGWGGVWGVDIVKSIDKNPIRVMSSAGSFSPSCFGMSEGCLEDSERCLGAV